MRALRLAAVLAFAAVARAGGAQPRAPGPAPVAPAASAPAASASSASASSASASSASAPSAALPPDFDARVARILRTFDVPGAAVAVVRDGRVLTARGYGVRALGRPEPVDADTRFGIASNTKAFTATVLAQLVEQGRIGWDEPVVRYLPDFALYDPWVTRELTVRDLLVHRSGLGLGAGDLLWWPASTYDRAEIVRRLRYVRPATSFRSAYAYDNVLYLVAGQLIERVTGRPWEDVVRDRILAPVGMTGSTVRHSDAAAAGGAANVATPHAEVDGRMRTIAPMTSDNTNPAGGINSTARDMARWMLVQLDSGRLADSAGRPRRLFTPASARELWSTVTPIPGGRAAPPGFPQLRSPLRGYALGFGTSVYRGRYQLQHSGGLPGYTSLVTMLPDERLGVAVLTNAESAEAWQAITLVAVDALLGVDPAPDYLGLFTRLRARDRAAVAAAGTGARAARDTASRPSLPLARYAGRYTDPWYGDVTVAVEGGRLVMRFAHTPQLVGDLEHWQHDTFVARWRDRELRADAYVTFALTPEGRIDQVKLAPTSPDVDFSYDFQDLLLTPAPAPDVRP